ncbi:MAG: histidine kinase [Flavobacteriaceae bacterium]
MNTKLNKSDFILLAIFYSVSIAIEAYDYYLDKNALIEYLVDFPTLILCSLALIYIFIVILIPLFIVKQKKYVLFLLFGLISLIFFGLIDYTIGFWTGGHDWAKYPKGISFVLTGINQGSDLIAFPLGILLTKKFYEGQTQLVKVKKEQKENELKLLRSQLDPHFLFNNLNALDALIDSDAIKAKEYINRLSLIYRYLIHTKDAEVMELSKEVDFAEHYIFLIKTRFTYDYDFSIINNNSINDTFIPTGALQTLLENVVKHNKVLDKSIIKTTVLIEDDWITVTNNKSNSGTNSESLGTGLENLKARYELLIDKEIQVIDTNTAYKISIPIIKLIEEN